MDRVIKIGTRDSQLALWQAKTVQQKLAVFGYKSELVPVKSTGDLVLDKPLYELGITGVFTKTLDVAMIHREVDIAVHSMKDVPTILPKGIRQTAVLERANTSDILVHKGLEFLALEGTIATGSLRRQAQWLNRYPNHNVVDLRGNVNSRLQKLADHDWNGAIFAKAGLERINILPENYIDLGWMIPAPAQGAMLVVTMEDDDFCTEALAKLNHKETAICTTIERDFLRTLEGGCTAPIGALAIIKNGLLSFNGVLFSLDGKEKQEIEIKNVTLDKVKDLGKELAKQLLAKGAADLMQKIKAEINK